MKKTLSEEEKTRACTATIEDFLEKIKELPIYGAYVASVKKDMENTNKFLQMSAMVFGTDDNEFSLMMTSAAIDLLFTMVDQRLRHEILEGE